LYVFRCSRSPKRAALLDVLQFDDFLIVTAPNSPIRSTLVSINPDIDDFYQVVTVPGFLIGLNDKHLYRRDNVNLTCPNHDLFGD